MLSRRVVLVLAARGADRKTAADGIRAIIDQSTCAVVWCATAGMICPQLPKRSGQLELRSQHQRLVGVPSETLRVMASTSSRGENRSQTGEARRLIEGLPKPWDLAQGDQHRSLMRAPWDQRQQGRVDFALGVFVDDRIAPIAPINSKSIR